MLTALEVIPNIDLATNAVRAGVVIVPLYYLTLAIFSGL